MIVVAALLGAQVGAEPSMTVTPAQFGEALAICRDQIAAPTFDRAALPGAGWPKVMSQGPDSAGYEMTTFRHPTTMMMVGLVSDPAKPSECSVIAPLGPELSARTAEREATTLFGKSKRGQWQTHSATVQQFPMPPGLRFTFTKKATQ